MGYALKEASDHRVKPDGGYVRVSTFHLGIAWWCYLEGTLSIRAVRVLLALHELLTERSAYVWTEKKRGRGVPEFTARFSVGEVAAFCGLPLKRARAALNELLSLGLVLEFLPERITFAESIEDLSLSPDERSSFSEWLGQLTKRIWVPMPRRILALACESSSAGQIAFILGASLHCVYLLGKGVGFRYTGKLSLTCLSNRFGVCLRALKAAKSHLVQLGWIRSSGRVTRYGQLHAVNPAWERIISTAEAPVENSGSSGTKSAPVEGDSGTKSALPRERESSFGRIKEPRESLPRETPGPGIFKNKGSEERPSERPHLSNIKSEDLRDVGRALELFAQAVKCRLVEDSEHSRLRWLAAIERARTVPARNPAGVFLHLVKNRLWGYLAEGHWEGANQRLKVHLYGPRAGSQPSPLAQSIGRSIEPERPRKPALSDDAKLVKAIGLVLRQKGIRNQDPMPYLRHHDPTWNRDRLLAAEVELSRPNYLEQRNPN